MWGAGCGADGTGPVLPETEPQGEVGVPSEEPPPTGNARSPGIPPTEDPSGPVTPQPAPPPSLPPPQPWSYRLGGPQDDVGTGIAVDEEGRVSWVWASTLREDGDRAPVDGQRLGLTLSRYTAAGVHAWTRQFPRSRVAEPRVAASGDGAVYLSGNAFLHAVELGLGAAEDGFLVRFSAEGEPVWQRRVGQKVYGLAADAEGNVLASGEEWTAKAHVQLLTRYTADGSVAWTRKLEGAGDETEVGAVALGPSGSAVLTGTLSGELELDDWRLGAAGVRSLFIFVFEPEGTLGQARVLTGVDGRVTAVETRKDGSVVVAGESQGALSWGGTTLPDGGPFLLTAGADGQEGWLRRPACDALGLVPSLAVESTGAVVTACGSMLSFYAPDGTPRGERSLPPESCGDDPCTLMSKAVVPVSGGGLLITGHQRDGVATEAWDQDAFLRLVVPSADDEGP
jgi:hypothetical protein